MPEKLPQEFPAEAVVEKESPKMELMKRSHEQALAAYKLERTIARAGKVDAHDEQVEQYLKELSPDIRKVFLEVIENYSEQLQDSELSMQALVDFVEENKLYGAKIENTPEWIGNMMFRQRTYNNPRGKVTFERREAYFMMICEDPEDYAQAAVGAEGDPNSKIGRLSGGTYHGAIYLKFPGRRKHNDDHIATPVVLMRGYKDPSEFAKVATHERQHFINNKLLGNFRDVEKKKEDDPRWRENSRAHAVKDEILAYIRDGSSGHRLQTSLLGELYTHLFENMGDEERQRTTDTIGKITEFLADNERFLEGKESRAILVYQLAGIPLEKIPNWLGAFREYYLERIKLMKPLSDVYDLDPDGGLHAMTEDVFPSDTQANFARGRMVETWNRMEKVEDDVRQTIFNLGNSKGDVKEKLEAPTEEYSELYKDLRDEAMRLRRNFVVMPHAGPSDLYEYGGDNENSRLGETNFTESVRAVVVDAVKDFPQSDVDAISEYLNGKDKPKPKSLRTLEQIIKKAVHAENGSQPCTVYFDTNRTYANSFEVTVDFKVNKVDQEEGIKGAWFPVNFHSSDFKLFPNDEKSSEAEPEPNPYEAASKRRQTLGWLGITAQDHYGFGSSPPFELSQNPGKTLGEILPEDKIIEFLDKLRSAYERYHTLAEQYPDNPRNKEEATKQKKEITANIHYLESVGRLPEQYRDFKF